MKRITLVLFIFVLGLAACTAPATPADTAVSTVSNTPIPSATVTAAMPESKKPAPSFEAQTYLSQ